MNTTYLIPKWLANVLRYASKELTIHVIKPIEQEENSGSQKDSR